MEEETKLPVVPNRADLFSESDDLTAKIIAEKDPEKLDDLTSLFLMNHKKKNLARLNKLSNLLDRVDDEALIRFTTDATTFDNDQLLKYLDVTQKNITSIEAGLANPTPLIQINTQKNNFNVIGGLNQDSRKKVFEAFMLMLNGDTVIEEEEEK